MKKILLTIIFILTTLSLVILPCAATKPEEEKQGFYASSAEQDAIYELLQQDSFDYKKLLESDGLTILKESITPVYTVDMLKFAETGLLEIERLENRYVAKMLDANENYAGNIEFVIKNDVADGKRYIDRSQNPESYMYSCSYADHAERIRKILKKDDFVPQSQVKLVFIDWVGWFFCVESEDEAILILVGKYDPRGTYEKDITLSIEKLKQEADRQLQSYNEFLAEKEAWEKEHPGELWSNTGYDGGSPVLSGCSRVNNILNISEYLSKGYQPEPSALQIVLVICGAILLCGGAVGGVMILKSRKKHQQG